MERLARDKHSLANYGKQITDVISFMIQSPGAFTINHDGLVINEKWKYFVED